MENNTKPVKTMFLPALALVAVAVGSLFLLHANQRPNLQAGTLTLFYGEECPHCKNVEAFIVEHNVTSTIPLVEKEVYHDDKNAAELVEAAKRCGLPVDSIGVPFLWDGSTCRVGEDDIVNFFKSKLGLNQ